MLRRPSRESAEPSPRPCIFQSSLAGLQPAAVAMVGTHPARMASHRGELVPPSLSGFSRTVARAGAAPGSHYKEGFAMNTALFIGADVSKHRRDFHFTGQPPLSLANNPRSVRRLVDRLDPAAVALIAVEATGGYERLLVRSLLDAGLPVAHVNPLQVRRYAQSRGILAKTDAVDAHVLADFARDNADRLRTLQP